MDFGSAELRAANGYIGALEGSARWLNLSRFTDPDLLTTFAIGKFS